MFNLFSKKKKKHFSHHFLTFLNVAFVIMSLTCPTNCVYKSFGPPLTNKP